METIRNRIDQFGVAEPLIQRQGSERIVVELPGVNDPDRVKDLIKVTAILEWKLVKAGPAPDEETLLKEFGGKVPEDMEVVKGDPKQGRGGFLPRQQGGLGHGQGPANGPPLRRRVEQPGRLLLA